MDSEIVRCELLHKSIKLLDGMKNETRDERPKTVLKLNNVLQKVNGVYFISSVLNVVLKYGKNEEIMIGDTQEHGEVRMSDEQIDRKIVDFALKEGQNRARQVLILPCDSNLHITVSSNVEDWYRERESQAQMDNSAMGIISASCLPHDLDPEELFAELLKHQYVLMDENQIKYNLPNKQVQNELEHAQHRFQSKFRTGLGDLSARGFEIFSREIIEANKNIQSNSVELLRQYCEEQYASKYSLYGEAMSDSGVGGVTEKLRGTSVGPSVVVKAEHDSDFMNTDQGGDADISTLSKVELIPVNITNEAAHVVMELLKAPRKPETFPEFELFVREKCGVIYIISPKYILSNIIKEKQQIPPNFSFNLLVGKQNKKTFKLGNLTELANMLTFPGKEKLKPNSPKRKGPDRSEPMDTSSQDFRKDIFESFQKRVCVLSKSKAERYQSVPVPLDQDAELRCKDRFFKWIQETNSNMDKVLTKETFTKELIELSFEFSRVPSNDLKQLLIGSKYLDVKEADGSVVYKFPYKNRTVHLPTIDTNRFLRYLAQDYKPEDTIKGSDWPKNNNGESRKRSAIEPSTSDPKRQKVIDI